MDPEARMTFFVVTVRAPSAPVTVTLPAPASFPRPWRTSTLFFFIKNSTPFAFLSTTRFR